VHVKAGQRHFLQRSLFGHRRWASRSPPSPCMSGRANSFVSPANRVRKGLCPGCWFARLASSGSRPADFGQSGHRWTATKQVGVTSLYSERGITTAVAGSRFSNWVDNLLRKDAPGVIRTVRKFPYPSFRSGQAYSPCNPSYCKRKQNLQALANV
jgi:hypothetical protein